MGADAPGWEPDPAAAPRRSPDVVGEELDGEMVLYDEAAGGLHVLNPTATLVWKGLDGTTPLGELAAELAAAADADPAVVRRDVLAVTAEFAALGLLAGIPADPETADPDSDGDR